MTRIDIDGLLDFIKDKAITALKGTIKELEDKLTDSNRYHERLIRDLENCCKRYEELEKENKELKEQLELNTANAVVIDMAQRLYKLKQTLKEIKEIAEHPKGCCIICDRLDKILQKISEVLDERI